jgi:membrane protein implicated in regulation of membrane protease activity
MLEWFGQLSILDQVLFAFAIVGSLLFVFQLLMMLIGGGEGDADAVDGGDVADVSHPDAVDSGASHADSDVAFKVFTVQGTVAFFMMLGWVGLAAGRTFGLGPALSVGLGLVAGVAANLLMAKIFQWFKNMQSSGTMDLRTAVGQEGEVYLTIKGDQPGKVQVTVQQHLKIFDALGEGGAELPTGTRVRVVRVVGGSTMVVQKV